MQDDPTLTNKWRTLGQELIKKIPTINDFT
jgi:hypothetical protein